MVATYEFIEEIKASGEQMHEMMVNAARKMREHQQELQIFEHEAAALAEGTPERQKLDFLVKVTRQSIEDYRFIIEHGRLTLNIDKDLLDLLENGA